MIDADWLFIFDILSSILVEIWEFKLSMKLILSSSIDAEASLNDKILNETTGIEIAKKNIANILSAILLVIKSFIFLKNILIVLMNTIIANKIYENNKTGL